jgi:periplasmic protein TonB
VPVVQHPVSKPVLHTPVLPQVQSATALTAPAQDPVAEPSPPQVMSVNEPASVPQEVSVKEVATKPQPETPPTISSGVEYIRAPQPSYPAAAKRRGEQGQVVFRVLISEQGQVEKLEIQKSSGFLNLDEAGRQAISKAAFKPYITQGKAIAVFVIVPISFKLDI